MTEAAESDRAVRAEGSPAPKSGDVGSLEDFVRYAYSRDGQRVAYPPATAKRVAAQLGLDDNAQRELGRLAADDVLFRVPWQMLAAAARARADRPVQSHLWNVVSEALKHHALARSTESQEPGSRQPISGTGDAGEPTTFSGPSSEPTAVDTGAPLRATPSAKSVLERLSALLSADENPRESPHEEVDWCLETVSSLSDSSLIAGLPTDVELAPRECNELRANLINTTVLALASREQWPTDRVVDLLHRHSWKPVRAAAAVDDPTVQLTNRPEGEVLALIVDVWESRLGSATTGMTELEGQVRRARNEIESLKRNLEGAEAQIVSLTTDVERLTDTKQQLELEIAERERRLSDGRAHASYDYEMLRSRAVQRAKRELELLGEGLHALRRPEPKLHVTADRLERALASLEYELARLREGDTP